MTFNERVTVGKPYVTGFILGLIAAPIIAFSAGWVSTTGARAEAVQNARIDTLAGICVTSAERIAASQSTDLETLKGYKNREPREALVSTALAGLDVPDDLSKQVAQGCSSSLS